MTDKAMVTEAREVLFFASYCGDDNPACSPKRPCPVCLGMSNVYEIPADTRIKYKRELAPHWLSDEAIEECSKLFPELPTAALAQAEQPLAWMDDGTTRSGSEHTAYRVVTDETKRGMPKAAASSFSVPLYAHPPSKIEVGENTAETAAPPVQHLVARPLSDWHEDHGFVTWWKFPVNEPSYIGSPLCEDWPGYHTHWTPHPDIPANAAALATTEGSDNV